MTKEFTRTVIDYNDVNRKRVEAELSRIIQAKDGGFRALANSLVNPVRKSLDIKGVMRQVFVTVTNWTAGVDFFYEKDLVRAPAVKCALGAGTYQIDFQPTKVRLDDLQIQAADYIERPRLNGIHTYDVMSRTKERVAEGMQIREDLILIALTSAACNSSVGNPVVATGGMLDKATLAQGFRYVEKTNVDTDGVVRQLKVDKVLIEATGRKGLRNMTRLNIDEKGFQELRETGSLGVLWNARFLESELVANGKAYVFAEDRYFGHFFLRSDVQIDMQEELRYNRVGVFGLELYAAAVTNPTGACEITFNPAM